MKEIYQYKTFPAGAILPGGWIKAQLERDLTGGYIGQFDRVHRTVSKEVFIRQDRTSKRSFRFEKEWWSGEHEGYWKDAVARMAYLTGNGEFIDKAYQWVQDIIEGSGKEGYIGIYDDCETKNCRFRHNGGNGELWTTSRILMALLAVFEFTGERKILDSAESAVSLIIRQYTGRNYFAGKTGRGGISHGVGFFEILEWLYRITADTVYLDFAQKLYGDFNSGNVRDDDLKTDHLLDEQRRFRDHGAHIAEGLFVPQFIAQIDPEPRLKKAAANVMDKLSFHTTPGGAMRCDEWIKGRRASADERYEYCGMAEMVSPLNRIFSFSGNTAMADRTETMVFNAAQGARLPVLSALSYFSSDNRIKINHFEIGMREHYDAVHPAAACCVLNGARLMPYYVEGMWMERADGRGITALLFGPSELKTRIRGVDIRIQEQTDYPFSDQIRFVFNPEKPVAFQFGFRKPFGCDSLELSYPEGSETDEREDEINIDRKWEKGDEVIVRFRFDIKKIMQPGSKTVPGKGMYFKRGPLVYSLPFDHSMRSVKEHRNSGFYRYRISARNTSLWRCRVEAGTDFAYIPPNGTDMDLPWDEPIMNLEGKVLDENGESREVSLVPMGHTIFRRVTFPIE